MNAIPTPLPSAISTYTLKPPSSSGAFRSVHLRLIFVRSAGASSANAKGNLYATPKITHQQLTTCATQICPFHAASIYVSFGSWPGLPARNPQMPHFVFPACTIGTTLSYSHFRRICKSNICSKKRPICGRDSWPSYFCFYSSPPPKSVLLSDQRVTFKTSLTWTSAKIHGARSFGAP